MHQPASSLVQCIVCPPSLLLLAVVLVLLMLGARVRQEVAPPYEHLPLCIVLFLRVKLLLKLIIAAAGSFSLFIEK